MAALYGGADTVSYLLDRGADPRHLDDLFQNGLHKASVYDREEIFKVVSLLAIHTLYPVSYALCVSDLAAVRR